MRILLVGMGGQVGFELQRALAPLGEIVAVDYPDCDLADPVSIRRVVEKACPGVVVNAAAYTAVDRAESEPERARSINTVAPGVVGLSAHRVGARVVHYSTDYVFDGTKLAPYEECDRTSPVSVYGTTKRDGEEALAASGAEYLTFRTSWVFGAVGQNFVKTVLRLAAERDSLDVVADQVGAPTPASLVADVTAHILGRIACRPADDSPPASTTSSPPARRRGTPSPRRSSEGPFLAGGRSVSRRGPSAPSRPPPIPCRRNARRTRASTRPSSRGPSGSFFPAGSPGSTTSSRNWAEEAPRPSRQADGRLECRR